MTSTRHRVRFPTRPMIALFALVIWLAAARSAFAVQPSERDVVFRNGTIALAGTMLIPGAAGPRAAVVLVHGSGSGPRIAMRPLAERCVAAGMVALIFDKRGSGISGGEWTSANLDDLADDALAAVSFLQSQPEVDSQHVGMFGISQGGWVVPRAATRRPGAFTFAMLVTGGGLKPIDVERHDYKAALAAIHASPEQHRDGMRLVERYFAYLKDGLDRAGLEQAIRDGRSEPWYQAVDVGRVMPTEATRAKWVWVPDYDPAADIATMRFPVLVLLGGSDRPALSAEMQRRWREALSHHPDASIVEILNADHGMTAPGTHHVGGGAQSFVPGYLDMLEGWIRAHCKCS